MEDTFDLRDILAFTPTLATNYSAIEEQKKTLDECIKTYKDNFKLVVEKVLPLIDTLAQKSQDWNAVLYGGIGTTMERIETKDMPLLCLDTYRYPSSPSHKRYIAHCLVAALFSGKEINCHARLDKADTTDWKMLEDIAHSLGLKTYTSEREEETGTTKWTSISYIFNK